MPVAAFRLTGSVSGFHDPSLVSVMVHVAPDARQAVHRTAARLPSMARERLCWAPWTGPTNGRRVSRVMSYLRTSPIGLRCPMMRRHYDARRCFELTGQVMPIHSPALVDLVGRVPGAPPE